VLGGAEDDDYGHLFGDTVFRQVEDAAVRAEDADDDADDGVPDPVAPHVPSAPQPAAVVDPDPAEEPDALISGVPGALSPSTGPRPARGTTPAAASRAAAVQSEAARPADGQDEIPTGDDALVDHDGHTVMSADLAALRAQAGATVQVDAAPRPGAHEVLARLCVDGHVNPPARETCRACGAALEGEPRLATPSVGRSSSWSATSSSGAGRGRAPRRRTGSLA
jgi:hypothetical protein